MAVQQNKANVREREPTERAPLLAEQNGYQQTPEALPEEQEVPGRSKGSVIGIIGLLLIGLFIANVDFTLVVAIYGSISSQFGQLESGSWLINSFTIASSVAQPISGKLSDIYGRKPIVLASYAIFAIGCLVCAFGQELWQVVLGRVISGIGGAGMLVVVSIIITDLVPVIEIASWRSYTNVVGTLGRSLGGPVGGWTADALGWRGSFLIQVPVITLAFILVAWKLPVHTAKHSPSASQKSLSQIDWLGAILLSIATVALLIGLDLGGRALPWSEPWIWVLLASAVCIAAAFLYVEANWSRDPIFPYRLLKHRDVITAWLISFFQLAAQIAMLAAIPLYFQVIKNASNSEAGTYLFPTVVGNTVGALLAGYFIKRTGRYKWMTVASTVLGALTYFLLFLTWRGQTSWLEVLETIPGGFATGTSLSATFVLLTANIAQQDMAMATSGMYLFFSLAQIAGITISSSVQQGALQYSLTQKLRFPGAEKIIEDVLSDVKSIPKLDPALREIVRESYIESLGYAHCVSIGLSVAAFLLSITIKEHPLDGKKTTKAAEEPRSLADDAPLLTDDESEIEGYGIASGSSVLK